MENRLFATAWIRFVLISLILSFGISSWAKSLTSHQALERALYSDEARSSAARIKLTYSQPQYTLVYADNQEYPAYYIFTPASQKGYLIISGDDAVPPILGYSDKGTFNLTRMPENMQNWLEQYSLQINRMRQINAPEYQSTSDDIWENAPISPLLSTTWSQDTPFNEQCPVIDNNHCLTGSVATSMAQIMRYHRYPDYGKGELSYEWNGNTLSTDFSSYYFAWYDMLDSYNSDYTAREVEAVSTIMSACGLSSRTNYSLTESTANLFTTTTSYNQYFDYNENTFFAYRVYHTPNEWNQLIYDQLQYVGPVQMKGEGAENSPCFVCDGYDQDGYFHINWGWGGNYNGYYLLNSLYPDSDLEEWSNVGFIGGISKPNSQYLHKEVVINSIEVTEIYSAERRLYLALNQWQNNCALTRTMNLGLKLVNEYSGQVTYVPFFRMTMPFGDHFTGSIMVSIPSSLPNGIYKATPAFSENDEWYDIYVNTVNPQSFSLILDESGINLLSSDSSNISCKNLTADTSFIWGRKCNLSFELVNSGEEKYAGMIRAAIFKGEEMCGNTHYWGITLAGETTEEFELSVQFANNDDSVPAAGIYTIYLMDSTGNKISNGVEVSVLDPSLYPHLNVIAVVANGPIYWDYPFDGKISLENTNKEGGEVKFSIGMYEKVPNEEFPGLFNRGNMVAHSPEYTLWLEPEQQLIMTSSDLEFIINQSVDGEIPPSGEYLLSAIDADGEPFSFISWVEFYNEQPPIPVTDITLDYDSLDLVIGEMFTLSVNVNPEDAHDYEINWSSSDTRVASVVNGEITALSVGTATIVASCDNCSASCLVNVSEPLVNAESVTLNLNEVELQTGETVQLTAMVLPENTTDKTVAWSSDNQTVAIVDNEGKLTAISGGRATITAMCGQAYDECNVIVQEKEPEEVPVENITLNLVEATLEIGGEVYLKATISPENATNQMVSWGTSNASIATVKDGWVRAISPGQATITAICDGMSTSCLITVNYPYIEPTGISLEPDNATLDIGESITLSANVMPEGATYGALEWNTSDKTVAVVTQGIVTALSPGAATIQVFCGNLTASCIITVNPPYVEVESITLNRTTLTLEVGTTFQLEAKVGPEDATNKTVKWFSDDISIATVDDSGLITPLSEGTVYIYAQADNVMATCKVKVKPAPIQYSLMLNASLICLDIDETYQLYATLYPAEETAEINWYSNNPIVALIDQTGMVYAVGRGNAIITAKYENASASCEFVIGKEKQEIVWNQTFDNLFVGDKVSLNATSTSGLEVGYGITEGSDKVSISGNVLSLEKEGTIEIYAYQNGDDTYQPAQHVNKTIKIASGIAEVNDDRMKIRTDGLILIIDGLKTNEEIEIFSIDGKVLYHGTEKRIALPSHGSYLVRTIGNVAKIML